MLGDIDLGSNLNSVDPVFKTLMLQMLAKDPEKRLSIGQCEVHPFFTEDNWVDLNTWETIQTNKKDLRITRGLTLRYT